MRAKLDIVPTAIRKHGDHALAIDWSDGHKSVLGFKTLRDNCPCASCREERENKPAGRFVPLTMSDPKGPLRPMEVNPVGRYAYSIVWSDGHASGIFSFELLRSLCQCDACRTAPRE